MCFVGAQANAGEGVRLAAYEGDKVNFAKVKGITECVQLAACPDVVSDMEDLAIIWCKQIEQVHNWATQTIDKTTGLCVEAVMQLLKEDSR